MHSGTFTTSLARRPAAAKVAPVSSSSSVQRGSTHNDLQADVMAPIARRVLPKAT
jgi:hypothetical protein